MTASNRLSIRSKYRPPGTRSGSITNRGIGFNVISSQRRSDYENYGWTS
jgi:hypothetical protein